MLPLIIRECTAGACQLTLGALLVGTCPLDLSEILDKLCRGTRARGADLLQHGELGLLIGGSNGQEELLALDLLGEALHGSLVV